MATVDNTYTLLEPLPCDARLTAGTQIDCQGSSQVTQMAIGGYVQYMFNLFIAVAAVAAVFMIVLGGFEYMTTDAIQGKEDGKKKMWHAIQGLLLVLCSFLILRTVNPQFVSIPTNLVEPLGIVVEKDPLGGLMAELDRIDAMFYAERKTEVAAAKIVLQDARAQEVELNAEIDDLEYQRNEVAQTDADKAALDNQIAVATDKLQGVTSNAAETLAETEMGLARSVAQTGASGGSMEASLSPTEVLEKYKLLLLPDDLSKAEKKAAYEQAVYYINQQVIAAQNTIDQQSTWSRATERVTTSGIFSETATAFNAKQAAQNNINQIVASYAQNPNADPALVAKVRAEATTATTKASLLKRQ